MFGRLVHVEAVAVKEHDTKDVLTSRVRHIIIEPNDGAYYSG